jgi:hypothetical protein
MPSRNTEKHNFSLHWAKNSGLFCYRKDKSSCIGHGNLEGKYRHSFTLSLISKLGGLGCQRHAPAFSRRQREPVPIVRDVGWEPGSFWAEAKNFFPTGIRSPNRPARSESLYGLSYRSPHSSYLQALIILFLKKRQREASNSTIQLSRFLLLFYYYYYVAVSCHRPFLPGISLEPTAQASRFRMQYCP